MLVRDDGGKWRWVNCHILFVLFYFFALMDTLHDVLDLLLVLLVPQGVFLYPLVRFFKDGSV